MTWEMEVDEAIAAGVGWYWASRGFVPDQVVEAFLGRRGEVVGGKQFDGMMLAFERLLTNAGVPPDWIVHQGRQATIPGWFRSSKNWDLLVLEPAMMDRPAVLHAVMEFKALGGPSYGNNANNRAEEAIGNAVDFWTAFREGAFGRTVHRPFLGYLIIVEDTDGSRRPVRDSTNSKFPVFPEFQGTSYIGRAALLCERLVGDSHYDAACVIASEPPGPDPIFPFTEPDTDVGPLQFVEALLRRVAPW